MIKFNEHSEPTAHQIKIERMILQSRRIQKRMAELAKEQANFKARNK